MSDSSSQSDAATHDGWRLAFPFLSCPVRFQVKRDTHHIGCKMGDTHSAVARGPRAERTAAIHPILTAVPSVAGFTCGGKENAPGNGHSIILAVTPKRNHDQHCPTS
jgi:hypothetical protein